MNKHCRDCGEEKPSTEFYKCGLGMKQLRLMCKTCFNKQQGLRLNSMIERHFGGFVCSECKFTGVPSQFDCHHIDPATKSRGISKMRNYSEKKINEELDKCELLCANCHRMK